jgi:UDP-2,4-diacetamido-2,4,6-trideoxy-beta-L-altropyranose hydrolase
MISNNLEIGHSAMLVLRADAAPAIGTGHVMRCIALAQSWKMQGGTAAFISNCSSHRLIDLIKSEGFGFVPVDHIHPNPDDLRVTIDFLAECKSANPAAGKWLVLDGYNFDMGYQKQVRDAAVKVLVIDDYRHLSEYSFDMLLNQNIGAETLDYDCSLRRNCLLGTRYVLLRKEFLDHGGLKSGGGEFSGNVLITLGGADIGNASLDIVRHLKSLKCPDLNLKVVIGPANLHQTALEAELGGSHQNYEIIVSSNNMPALMQWADVAVSAAGSTCWELAYMGIPSAVVILADNQQIIAEGLEKSCAAVNLGSIEALTATKFKEGFLPLLEDEAVRSSFIRNQRKLVDGRGADRVVERMT